MKRALKKAENAIVGKRIEDAIEILEEDFNAYDFEFLLDNTVSVNFDEYFIVCDIDGKVEYLSEN